MTYLYLYLYSYLYLYLYLYMYVYVCISYYHDIPIVSPCVPWSKDSVVKIVYCICWSIPYWESKPSGNGSSNPVKSHQKWMTIRKIWVDHHISDHSWSGWWYTYPSEKMVEFVRWDDDIPNMMGKSYKIPRFQSPPTSDCIYPSRSPLTSHEKSPSLMVISTFSPWHRSGDFLNLIYPKPSWEGIPPSLRKAPCAQVGL